MADNFQAFSLKINNILNRNSATTSESNAFFAQKSLDLLLLCAGLASCISFLYGFLPFVIWVWVFLLFFSKK